MCFYLSYPEILTIKPNGDHIWRQTDGLAIAHEYYKSQHSFWEPSMLNQLHYEGKAVGEFPILYYAVSKLYKIFGQSDTVYRLFCWMLCFLGYFALFRLITHILNDFRWGVIISLLTFSSPILIYYGISFLPDPIALSFVFISWYFIHQYSLNQKKLNLFLAFLFATLAGLLKVSAYISFIAIGFVFIISIFKSKQFKSIKYTSIQCFFLFSILIITAWFYYAQYYNNLHQSKYFFLKFAPIWDLNAADRTTVWNHISNWTKEFFHPTGRHVFYGFALLSLIPFGVKKEHSMYYFLNLTCLIGCASFFILFFQQFKDHDYYMVTLLFIIPMLLTTFILRIKKYLLSNIIKFPILILFFILLIASTIYSKNRTEKRISNKSEWVFEELYNIEPQLVTFGIGKEDLILAPFDPSANITLYALKRKGWTRLNGITNTKAIQDKLELGAKWIIVPIDSLKESGYLLEFINEPTISNEKIAIYRIIKPNPQN